MPLEKDILSDKHNFTHIKHDIHAALASSKLPPAAFSPDKADAFFDWSTDLVTTAPYPGWWSPGPAYLPMPAADLAALDECAQQGR